MAKVKDVAKELTETQISDNGEIEAPTLQEERTRIEAEMKHLEAEYHKRVGMLELLNKMEK